MSQLPKPYKMGFIGLLGILAITIVPFDGETNSNDGRHYGMATLVQYDVNNNEVFAQSIHNRLVDTGETFILGASFFNGVASPVDNTAIGAICVAEGVISAADETDTAAQFDTDNTIGVFTNCIVDATVDITTTQGTAIVGPETFTGATHLAGGDTVNGIGICQGNGGVTPYQDCATGGVLFAVIDTADVTLLASETVQITYTFDITSPAD